jgi:hypothetical protein
MYTIKFYPFKNQHFRFLPPKHILQPISHFYNTPKTSQKQNFQTKISKIYYYFIIFNNEGTKHHFFYSFNIYHSIKLNRSL